MSPMTALRMVCGFVIYSIVTCMVILQPVIFILSVSVMYEYLKTLIIQFRLLTAVSLCFTFFFFIICKLSLSPFVFICVIYEFLLVLIVNPNSYHSNSHNCKDEYVFLFLWYTVMYLLLEGGF